METSLQNVTDVSTANQYQILENSLNVQLILQNHDIEQLTSSCIATLNEGNNFHLNLIQEQNQNFVYSNITNSTIAHQKQELMPTDPDQNQEVSDLDFSDLMDLLSSGEVEDIPDIGE